MPVLKVILREPAWPELDLENVVHVTSPLQVTGLDHGMASGAASVMLRLDLPDGRTVLAETSLALFTHAAAALQQRYGRKESRS